MMMSETRKRSRSGGQIFIILTMLIMIYLVLIASASLELERSEFVEPASNADAVLAYVDLTDTFVADSMKLVLGRLTQGLETPGSADTAFRGSLNEFRDFMARSGVAIGFSYDSVAFASNQHIVGLPDAANAAATVELTYDLTADTVNVRVTREFSLAYQMLMVSNLDNEVNIESQVDGVDYTVAYAVGTVLPGPVSLVSNFDGSFSRADAAAFATGETIDILIDGCILLSGTVQ